VSAVAGGADGAGAAVDGGSDAAVDTSVGLGTGVTVAAAMTRLVGVAVGGRGIAVGGRGVAVGGIGVAVGGIGVAVGGTGVAVGGTGVVVGGTGVAVGGTGVAVGGTGVAVGTDACLAAQATRISSSKVSRLIRRSNLYIIIPCTYNRDTS
jgi:hypothetical protein